MAHDGAEAVEKALAYQPDVVLLDIGLPKMNGYDVCGEIRKARSRNKPVIVALTGWGQDEDRKRSTQAGFDAHVIKPVDYRALEELINSLWNQANHGLPAT